MYGEAESRLQWVRAIRWEEIENGEMLPKESSISHPFKFSYSFTSVQFCVLLQVFSWLLHLFSWFLTVYMLIFSKWQCQPFSPLTSNSFSPFNSRDTCVMFCRDLTESRIPHFFLYYRFFFQLVSPPSSCSV